MIKMLPLVNNIGFRLKFKFKENKMNKFIKFIIFKNFEKKIRLTNFSKY